MRSAIVAGASGLVGDRVLRRLLAGGAYDRVVALVRGPLNVTHKKLEQRTIDYERIGRMSAFPRAEDVFCCLGTTLRKAGSPEAFRKVDVEYVVRLAEACARAGSAQFLLVSAVGADARSRNFYLRCKGEAERPRPRPPVPVGPRVPAVVPRRSPAREPAGRGLGVTFARLLSFAMLGPARRYRPDPGGRRGQGHGGRGARRAARDPRLRGRRDAGPRGPARAPHLSRARMSVMRFFWSSGAMDSAFV